MTFFEFRDHYTAILRQIRIAQYHIAEEILQYPKNVVDGYMALELSLKTAACIDLQRANLVMAQTIPYQEAMRKIIDEAVHIAKFCASVHVRTECFQSSKELESTLTDYLNLLKEIITDEGCRQIKDWCSRQSDDGTFCRLAWEETDSEFCMIAEKAVKKYSSGSRSGYIWQRDRKA